MNIFITAGGTREPIDSVRCITNSSTGKLGAMIAREFHEQLPEANIYYIHGKGAIPANIPLKRNIEISSAQNLMDTLTSLKETGENPDIICHAMAVSDYTVKEVLVNGKPIDKTGKISSTIEEPQIILQPTVKVISQIKKLWPTTFLVGFKLLDSVSKETLFQTAFQLLRRNRCNMVLANDLSEIRAGNHIGMVVYPEKTHELFYGKEAIAKNLVRIAIFRENVLHFRSKQTLAYEAQHTPSIQATLPFLREAGRCLEEMDMLPHVVNYTDGAEKSGTYGNLSMRIGDRFVMTGRNVDKGNLTEDDLTVIYGLSMGSTDNPKLAGEVAYTGSVKPSIDSSIHAMIYEGRPDVKAIIHVHTNHIDGIPTVEHAYPCGCFEEAIGIKKLAVDCKEDILQMKNHGLVILGSSLQDCIEKLQKGENNYGK